MGIPTLTSHLSPHAIPIILGCSNHPNCPIHSHPSYQSKTNIIIDGPSFAYAIYKKLIINKSGSFNALEKVPSYHEIGEATLELLNGLERGGVVMYVELDFLKLKVLLLVFGTD